MDNGAPLVVITDLDGTLLDHHSYSYAAALPALNRLKQLAIPLILCSSKTATELQQLRNRLDNDAPFVSENGACIHLPGKDGRIQTIPFAPPRTAILALLRRIRQEHGFRFCGFADMDAAQIAQLTGLTVAEAQPAAGYILIPSSSGAFSK
jgi:mannosyl-3-phosphoglycerate phosphatase